MVAAGSAGTLGRRRAAAERLYSVALVEPGDWDDDADASDASDRFASAPLPPHERTWRHPSELGAAQWAASEPPLVIGRGLSVVTGTIGLVLAAGLLWAMLPAGGGSPAASPPTTVRLGRDAFSTVPVATRPDTSAPTLAPTTAVTTPTAPPQSPLPTVVLSAAADENPRPAVTLAAASGPLAITTDAAIAGASSIEVTLPTGEVVTAQVLMVDPRLHVAVLSLPTSGGEATWQTADAIADGDAVVVVGAAEVPATLKVSDSGVMLVVDSSQVSEAAPVVDAEGRLVGLCTHRDDGVALVAAADITRAASKVDGMALTTPWLGIELTDDAGSVVDAFGGGGDRPGGLTISRVTDGGPAAAAGLMVGDRLVAIDGVEVSTLADVVGVLSHHRVGDVVAVDVVRAADAAPGDTSTSTTPTTVASTTAPSSTGPPPTSSPSTSVPTGVGGGSTTALTTTSAPSTTVATSAPTTAPASTAATATTTPPTILSMSVTLAARPSAL